MGGILLGGNPRAPPQYETIDSSSTLLSMMQPCVCMPWYDRYGIYGTTDIPVVYSLTDEEAEEYVHLPALHGRNLCCDVQVDAGLAGGGAKLRERREIILHSYRREKE